MKKVYEAPAAKLEMIATEDIITTSEIEESTDIEGFTIIEFNID